MARFFIEVILLYSTFSSVLDSYHQRGKTVVLALSGGVDSRVMLQLLSEYKQNNPRNNYLAVHVHHGLSANADSWVEKCQNWCQESNIPLTTEYVNLELGSQISIEQEARDKRYLALGQHIFEGDTLLTGQHLSDQTETFLLALKRGSGPKGLSSMPDISSFEKGRILRPLLQCSREEIVRYANERNLEWVEDESNTDDKYDRNFLRNNIVPSLKQRWPHIENAISRSADLCSQQELLIEELLAERLGSMMSEDLGLSIEYLANQSTLARNQLIRMWLSRSGWLMPSQKQLEKVWTEVALAKEDANPRLNYASGELRRYKNRIYMVPRSSDISEWHCDVILNERVTLPDDLGTFEVKSHEQGGSVRLPIGDEKLWVAFDPEGLSAHPCERGHSRSLKKLFQEYGVPSWQRRRIPILMVNDRVAAVVGLFVDKAFSGNDCELVWNKTNQ
ncbi:tRNA lysidine(34) synthetase TilS [Vibrio hannami]|uniref:tRNA lysidine(34) synthetase TilS n=1 Tax=Vibrio hannami TaxID=2717094 RepID=UPI00241085DD|nr:tRNA lysidine(34) synthetase TilS [Vibrio hannami]MDG3088855.1 tRNA lysidine(34) synthetase TilS [Vibrio hannami]